MSFYSLLQAEYDSSLDDSREAAQPHIELPKNHIPGHKKGWNPPHQKPSQSARPKPDQTVTFLLLPQELRNKVYSLLMQPNRTTLHLKAGYMRNWSSRQVSNRHAQQAYISFVSCCRTTRRDVTKLIWSGISLIRIEPALRFPRLDLDILRLLSDVQISSRPNYLRVHQGGYSRYFAAVALHRRAEVAADGSWWDVDLVILCRQRQISGTTVEREKSSIQPLRLDDTDQDEVDTERRLKQHAQPVLDEAKRLVESEGYVSVEVMECVIKGFRLAQSRSVQQKA